MRNYIFRSFMFFISFACCLSAIQKDDLIINEYCVSPDVEGFDCHSSCIIETSPGVLAVVWKGGAGKGKCNIDMKENVGIWISFFKDGCWSEPKQMIHSSDTVCWSPVLSLHPNGELTLFYRYGRDPRHTVSMLHTYTDSSCKTLAKESYLPGVGPTKSKPLIDEEGNLICGSSVEVGEPDDEFKETACWIEVLADHGWSKYGPIEIPGKKFGCIEPALFWGRNGTLKMLCRDRSNRIGLEGWIWMAESQDRGKTWSELKQTNLPNPDSGIDVVSLDNDTILVFYNHSHTDRYPLSVAVSTDSGNSWDYLFNIEEESGEFPSAALDCQGNVHVTIPGARQEKPSVRSNIS